MSIPVRLEQLRGATQERGRGAYVLTVADDGRPHAVHAEVRWERDALIAEVGRRTAGNAAARPSVSLLYPGRTEGDYSLIVDGTAAVVGHRIVVTPTKAVLHRPAPSHDPRVASCDSDCVPVLPATTKRRG